MKYSATAINSNENRRPTSLLNPSTSPLAKTKLRLAILAMMTPENIAPKTPQIPTNPPSRYAMIPILTVEAN